jgi:threonyl-tRNA synthetase
MESIIQGWQCPLCQKVHSPFDKTCNCQNKPKVKEFTPPTLDEVKAYFKENGYKEEIGERAWRGYEAGKDKQGNWFDSRGQRVKSWKQKMQHVWFKDEHRIVKTDFQNKIATNIPLKRLL